MARRKLSKILMISPEKCIGCRSCELICSFGKQKEFNPRNAAVSVFAYDEAALSVPIMCMQCEEPSCMKVCPTSAISKSMDGNVLLDSSRCIGCKMCISACPVGNISYNAKQKQIVKCDLCGGEPKCAEFCPSGAINYVEATSTNLGKKKKLAGKFKELFGEVNE
ncbi:MAG TPA: 4Fe-4S dicluster domain-containing protein [Clostridia bacterium]|nr:4Fe-4S dicluster domain-containing protein [Clostridia bacterium]